jgi:hypothetical protein
MPTQLDDTWLPSEARVGWDGTLANWPLDYGSGEYRNLSTLWEKNIWAEWGTMSGRISTYGNLITHSDNIRMIREQYERWSWQNTKEIQKLTDGKHTITIDDILWYLRYENIKSIKALLWETNSKNENIFHLPSFNKRVVTNWTVSHRLLHWIQKAIEEISWKK